MTTFETEFSVKLEKTQTGKYGIDGISNNPNVMIFTS